MPIKLPKGFTRRKSSGNALDDVEPSPQPSFRVFERAPGDRKSFHSASLLSPHVTDPSHAGAEDPDNNIFAASENPPYNRGSGGTDRSGYSGGMYESSSSVRFSSSSTCPSSSEAPTQDDSHSPHSRPLYDIPAPPRSGPLRAGGQAFSLGARFSKGQSTPPPPPPLQHSSAGPSRDRAITASTARTATPPKLLDTNFNIGTIGDDFESVFDNIGLGGTPTSASSNQENAPQLSSIDPESRDHRRSQDRLLSGFDPDHSVPAAQPTRSPNSIPNSKSPPIPTTSHRSLEKPRTKPGNALRRSLIHTERPDSSLVEDDDAKLVLQSLLSNKEPTPPPLTSHKEESDGEGETSLFENNTTLDPRKTASSQSHQTSGMSDSQPDSPIATHARLVAQYEQNPPKPASSQKKVMTPSQFEHYRQQQELRRSNSDASKSDDSVHSEFDEEDEAEKNREAERQRRKQEAHLSVYRQQMMKVTGQRSPGPSLRSEKEGPSSSTPNLGVRSSNHVTSQGAKSGSGKSSEGDEDDEVPLGILAAHGFPNKARPPTNLGTSRSIPNLRASVQPPLPTSGVMPPEHDQGNRGSLPVFARNLPRDPYYGASLVNPSNRESLALGGGAAQGTPPPGLPPGGLVGVIASEERARAIRRSSPNTQGAYENQAGMPGMNPYANPMPNSQSTPGQGYSPMENTQMQLSQQMTHMMQTQMQWMQQMMQMQGIPGMLGTPQPQSQIPKPFPPSPLANPDMMRPVSMPSGPALSPGPMGPRADPRALSMLDANSQSHRRNSQMPYMPEGNRPGTPSGQGYAASIAPSERSNVGMAPRYRPVSTLPQEQKPNGFASVPKPWGDENRKSVSFTSQSRLNAEKLAPAPTVTIRPVSPGDGRMPTPSPKFEDEADDDEGWAEMMKKRERKKDGWKAKRTTSSLGNLMNVVH